MSLRIRCLLRTRSFLRRGFCLLALTGSSIYLIFAQTAPNADEPDTCAADGSRTADWRTLIPNTLHDQKRIFATFPNQVIHGKHWIPILAVAAAATGLIVVDQYDTPYFRRTKTLKTFNSVFSSANTATGIVLMPVAFYSAGYFLKSGYMKETADSGACE